MIKFIPLLLQSVAADHCKSYVSISDLVTNDQCQAKCTTSHDCVLLGDAAPHLTMEENQPDSIGFHPGIGEHLISQTAASPSLRSSTGSTSDTGPWDYELLPLECGFAYIIDVDPESTAQKLWKQNADEVRFYDLPDLSFEVGMRGAIGFDKATGSLFGLANPTSGGHQAFALGYGQDGTTFELRKYNVKTSDGSILSAGAACDVFSPQDGSAGYYTCCSKGTQCGFFRLSDTKGPEDHFVWQEFWFGLGSQDSLSTFGDISFEPYYTSPTLTRFCAVDTDGNLTQCSVNFETMEIRCEIAAQLDADGERLSGLTFLSSYFDEDLNLLVHDFYGSGYIFPFTDGKEVRPHDGFQTWSIFISKGELDGASCQNVPTRPTEEPENSTTETATIDPTTEEPENSTTETATIDPTTEEPVDSTIETDTMDATTEEPENSTTETATMDTTTDELDDNGWIIVGSAVGGLLVLAAAATAGCCLGRCCRKSSSSSEETA